nr:DEAD/DEAH box helicase family protein [Pseudomonadota bacterium]
MSKNFKDQPIINSPYKVPDYHYKLDTYGEPLDGPPVSSRRESKYSAPVPKARKKKSQDDQSVMSMHPADGFSTEDQEYNPTPIIKKIRSYVAVWRVLEKESDWGVTPPTARLLNHWRKYKFTGIRPFFCQIEAVETIIWLTEVAPNHPKYKPILDYIKNANASANPDLTRLAMKMATGAGKTTVMAMLIAWHVANAESTPSSNKYSRGFLIVTPGITIRDRLRVLLPSDPDNYYEKNELVPREMLQTMLNARIVIKNYHALQRQDVVKLNKISRAFIQGHGAPLKTEETDKEIVNRVAKDLKDIKNIIVINDEAHHCYEEKKGNNQIKTLKGDEKKDAEKENKAARVWINGLRAFKNVLDFGAIYDLSATPFFLNGSGWREGTLFPWVVSDFSLIDAIECGIVKLPRVPIADNTISGEESPVFRNLWDHIGKDMPKKGRQNLNPQDIPETLQNALDQLYALYKKTDDVWRKSGVDTPPVFIVVCNNTTTSKLIFDYIAGWTRTDENGVEHVEHGRFDLFNNFDENNRSLPQ